MVKTAAFNLYCFAKKMLLNNSSECLSCENKTRIIFKERGYISCENIRDANEHVVNTIISLEQEPETTYKETGKENQLPSENKEVEIKQSFAPMKSIKLEFEAPPIKVILTSL